MPAGERHFAYFAAEGKVRRLPVREPAKAQSKSGKNHFPDLQKKLNSPLHHSFPEKKVGFPEKSLGFSGKQVGFSGKQVGFYEKQIGFYEKQIGFYEKTVGFYEKTVGFP